MTLTIKGFAWSVHLPSLRGLTSPTQRYMKTKAVSESFGACEVLSSSSAAVVVGARKKVTVGLKFLSMSVHQPFGFSLHSLFRFGRWAGSRSIRVGPSFTRSKVGRRLNAWLVGRARNRHRRCAQSSRLTVLSVSLCGCFDYLVIK